MRDIYTLVEYEDRTFRIRKMAPYTAMYIAKLLAAKIAPLGAFFDGGSSIAELGQQLAQGGGADAIDGNLFELIGKALDSVTEDELRQIITKSLAVCAEMLPAGDALVLDPAGRYGVVDMEYNLELTLCLTIEAIKWSAQDFFGGKLWGSIRRATTGFIPPSTATSTPPSTPQ